MKNLGQINDPKDIVTKEYVDTQISNSEVDLTDYVKNTDYATSSKGGVVKVYSELGVSCVNGNLALVPATNAQIDARLNESKPITPKNLEYAVKSVGDGYYITDTDYATGSKGGVGKISTNFGILVNTNGYFYPMVASEEEIDAKTHKYHIIAPANLEYAVKSVGDGYYALASTITALENRIAQLEAQLAGVEAQLAEI